VYDPLRWYYIFSNITLIISFPTCVASGNLGRKYSCILSNRSRYDAKSPNDTHSDHAWFEGKSTASSEKRRKGTHPSCKSEFEIVATEALILNGCRDDLVKKLRLSEEVLGDAEP